MEEGLNLKSPSLATHYLRMIAETGTPMSTCTGFLYEHGETIYLITNGHNLTRMNPEQTERISEYAAFPTLIKTRVRKAHPTEPNKFGLSDMVDIAIYNDEAFQEPTWYIHPVHGYLIDVVAIPVIRKDELPKHVLLFPINNCDFDSDFGLMVSDDVFILGYPFDISGGMELPIWKRGTIASETGILIDKLPKIYVDTATRSGMSGSPVIMKRTGFHGFSDDLKEISPDAMIGTIQDFIGVYSGRIGGRDEFQAQLGIIWRKEVVNEIINGQVLGTLDFQNK